MRKRSASSQVPKEFAEAAGQNPTQPYHGYYFRVLKEQGPNAPGGQHPYMFGEGHDRRFRPGGMARDYGVTGIHTFIVNQDGVVYEKDRGAHPPRPLPATIRTVRGCPWTENNSIRIGEECRCVSFSAWF